MHDFKTNTRKTNSKHSILLLILAFATSILSIACDSNIPRADQLTADYSISIAKFTADDSVLALGNSTILKWEVEDDNGTVDYVYISPDIGTVATSGSKQVTPQQSTTYTLTVYVNNEPTVTQSRQVTVQTADGNEVITPPADEICDDTTDNDLDGKVDCEDDDCVEFEACVVAPVTYGFTVSPTASNTTPIVHEEVTIHWESNYDKVTLNDTAELFGTDEFTFIVDASGIYTFTFKGFAEGVLKEEVSLEIVATEVVEETPEFSAIIESFSISPTSKLIFGQPYEISWQVTNAAYVSMDSYESNRDTVSFTANADTSHRLEVIDENGLTSTRQINVDVSSFIGNSKYIEGTINQIIAGPTASEFYLLTSTGVYKTLDYLAGEATQVVTAEEVVGTISAFAVKDATYFIGTDQGLFVKEAEVTRQVGTTAGTQTYTSIVVTKNGRILAGTDHQLHEVIADVAVDETDVVDDDGYRIERVTVLGSTVNVKKLFLNPEKKRQVFAVTDGGVYFSTDNGHNFVLKSDSGEGIVDGYWFENGEALIWSEHNVFIWNADTESFTELRDLQVSEANINFVVEQSGRYFIAASSGVYASFTAQDGKTILFKTNLTTNTDYVLAGISSTFSGNTQYAIKPNGRVSTLNWFTTLYMIPMDPQDLSSAGRPVSNADRLWMSKGVR